MHHSSVLSPLLFAIVIDVVTYEIKECTLREILYADDLVFIAVLQKNHTCKSALECRALRVNLVKTKVMVSKIEQIIIKPSSRKDPCCIYGRKTMTNAALCKSCGNWMLGTCTNINRVTNTLQ